MSALPALHPLGVGELLDAAIYVYRKSFVTLIGISAVVAIPLFLLQSAAAFLNAPIDPFFGGLPDGAPPYYPSASSLVYLAVSFFASVLAAIAWLFETGAIAFAVSERRMGRRVTVGGAYRQALRHWTSLLGSTILIGLFIGAILSLMACLFGSSTMVLALGSRAEQGVGATLVSLFIMLLFFSPALVIFIYVMVRWSLTMPAIVLENLGALRGMGRSWRLVKGSFRRVFAVLAVVGVLVNVLTYVVTLGVQFGALALLRNSVVFMTIATSAASLVVNAVIQPLMFAVITLLYYDLRVRREGYDLQLALEQLRQSTPPAAVEGTA